MGVTSMLRGVALTVPRVATPLLRFCLHRTDHVPPRFEWVVDSLKRDLPLPWERRQVRLDDGSRLMVDSRSAIGREVYYRGSYEPELRTELARWLRPGMIFVDAGANIGEFTVRAARLVGASGSVHAFEASPSTFEDLRQNVELNGAANVVASQVALGASPGEVEFFLSNGIASGSSSLKPAHDYGGIAVRVPSTTLDIYAEQARLPHVDLLKIDIEGAELEAFRGASGLFRSPHAPIVIFEYHPVAAARFGVSRTDVVGFLEGFGYRMTPLGLSAGAVHGAENLPENLVALPPRVA